MSSHMSQIYVLATGHVLSSNQSPIGHAKFMHHSFYCPKHFSVCYSLMRLAQARGSLAIKQKEERGTE